jgi:hypothetical protein
MRISGVLAALSLSSALVLGSQVPAGAAPVTALWGAAKPAAQIDPGVVQVRFGGGGFRGGWGGGWHGGGWHGGGWHGGGWHGGGWRGGGWDWGVGGLAAGALIGAAIAAPYAWDDPYYAYGGYPVAYPAPYYGPYGYGPGPYWRRPVVWGPGWW